MAFQEAGCGSPNENEVSYLNKIAGPPSCSVLPGPPLDRKNCPKIDVPGELAIVAGDVIAPLPLEITPDKMAKSIPCPVDKKATIKFPPEKKSVTLPPKRKPPAKPKSRSPVKKVSASVQAPTTSTCNLRKEEEPVTTKKSDKKVKKKSKSRNSSPSPSVGGCSGDGGGSRSSSPAKKKRRGV